MGGGFGNSEGSVAFRPRKRLRFSPKSTIQTSLEEEGKEEEIPYLQNEPVITDDSIPSSIFQHVLKTNTKEEEEEEEICYCYLPDELVTEILEWLPIKSIVKFRLVSKSMSALFRNPSFIRNHRLKQQQRAKHGGKMLLLRRCHTPPFVPYDYLSFHDLDSPEQELRPEIRISEHLEELLGHYHIFSILGHVNGIICIFNTGMRFILCNPALHEFKLLPPIPFSKADNINGYRNTSQAFGFGVSSSGDFKVIAFHRFVNATHKTLLPCVVAHLYNSTTNAWSRFDDSTLFPCSSTLNADCILNGAWHWPGTTLSSDHQVIVSFHVTSEVFRQLELPYSLRGSDYFNRLCVVNNCLGVVHYKQFYSHSEPGEVWVMKEYGVNQSWNKLFVISPQPHATTLLPWKNDTMFMLQQHCKCRLHGLAIDYDSEANDQLTSTNLRTSEVKHFQVFGGQTTIRAMIYEESLVSLK